MKHDLKPRMWFKLFLHRIRLQDYKKLSILGPGHELHDHAN